MSCFLSLVPERRPNYHYFSVFIVLFILSVSFFFFNDTATTEIYTLSLHDALPICLADPRGEGPRRWHLCGARFRRSEEHTSELQSRGHLVCRLLLEKKKQSPRNKNPHLPQSKTRQIHPSPR